MTEFNKPRNRQALRSIKALQGALLELLEEKKFQKISITDISERSGLTRSTFYSHFSTKDELLDSIINTVIDNFFEQLYSRDVSNPDPEKDLEMNIDFFRIWEKNKDLIPLLESVDFDCLLIGRIRAFWDEHYEKILKKKNPEFSDRYTNFANSFLASTFVGLLKEWINQDMQASPELMGELLYFFSGPKVLMSARSQFQEKFK
ncbi:MAG: TetR/AcrR family transcriptional regulator [Chloroflexota bacterium]